MQTTKEKNHNRKSELFKVLFMCCHDRDMTCTYSHGHDVINHRDKKVFE